MAEQNFQSLAWWEAVMLIAGLSVRPLQWFFHPMDIPEYLIQPSTDGTWLAEVASRTITTLRTELEAEDYTHTELDSVLDLFARCATQHPYASADKVSSDFTNWLGGFLRDEWTRVPAVTVRVMAGVISEFRRNAIRLEHFSDSEYRHAIALIIELGFHLSEVWYMSEVLEQIATTGILDEAAKDLERINTLEGGITSLLDYRVRLIDHISVSCKHGIIRNWARNTSKLVALSDIRAGFATLVNEDDAEILYQEYLSIVGE